MQGAVATSLLSGVKRIIETGCIRGWAGDGQSTLILATLAIRAGAEFHSVDISQDHQNNAKAWLGELADCVQWHCCDSVEFLAGFDRPVDFLYLDSYDYDIDNPEPCQKHQLAEIMGIYPQLAEEAVVLLDDANQDGGGKVKLTKEFLKSKNWRIEADHYQTMLRRISIIGDA